MRLLALLVATCALAACTPGEIAAPPAPTPSPAVRPLRPGQPQVTLRDPSVAARAWLIASAVTRPGGVVVIGVDDIALRLGTHRAIRGTLELADDAAAWGRSVLYVTTNPDVADVRSDLTRAGFPHDPVWTPKTAPWCGSAASDVQFRAACVTYVARRSDVVLWLTRGSQLPTPADRTYAFPG